jgi:hypothetical protein
MKMCSGSCFLAFCGENSCEVRRVGHDGNREVRGFFKYLNVYLIEKLVCPSFPMLFFVVFSMSTLDTKSEMGKLCEQNIFATLDWQMPPNFLSLES